MGIGKSKTTLLIMTVFVLLFFCKCNAKPSITESIIIENNELIITLNNTIPKRRIGNVDDLLLNGGIDLKLSVKRSDETVIIISDITNHMDCFYDDEECKFKIKWPGGRILITAIYKDGQFTILNEGYINRI